MLRITKLADAEYLLRQVALGIDDYYVGAGEAPGVWHGRLAAELGLAGVVEADALRALLLNRDPATDAVLVTGGRRRTVTAFDVTFSAPKSVSLLWAFASPEVASVASIAHVEAVAVALDFLERRAGATRQQVDGERQRLSAGLVAGTFVHRTSRDGDPQLHTHSVVVNLGRRPDGTYAALDAAPLYEWGKAAGSVYQEELRRRLTEQLGVEWGLDRHGCREIAGFDQSWLRTFSKRTVAIDEHLAGAGPENADPVMRMKADEAASLATRPRKDGSLTPEVLRERWQGEADAIRMPHGHALEAAVCDRTVAEFRPRLEWADVVEALVDPEDGLCAHRARFGAAHVVEQVAALGAGRLHVETVEDLAEAFLDDAVLLADRTGRRGAEYSTFDHLALEQRVLDHLGDLTILPVDGLDPALVEQAITTEEPGLGADQADAVRALCEAGPAIRSLIAPAGFGKTTTVHAAAVAANRAGHPVVGLAATNQAAGELRQAGIDALTIARFARDGAVLRPGSVVVLDEVSQVATADAEIVLAAVAATPGAVLWCLGDPHQAQAVRAGGLGSELVRLGQDGWVPSPALTENRRQLEPAERQALTHYRAGLVATSQAIRRRHGWEHDLGSPHATREALADAVVADVVTHGPAGVVALAISHADCEDLADRSRSRLRAAGHLCGPELAGPAWGNGERRYAAGDRILVHGTLRTNGQRLHNGSVLTITAVGDDGLRAVTEHNRAVVLPRAFIAGHRSDGSPNCSHAWARTVDGIQGGTWPQIHLLGTAALATLHRLHRPEPRPPRHPHLERDPPPRPRPRRCPRRPAHPRTRSPRRPPPPTRHRLRRPRRPQPPRTAPRRTSLPAAFAERSASRPATRLPASRIRPRLSQEEPVLGQPPSRSRREAAQSTRPALPAPQPRPPGEDVGPRRDRPFHRRRPEGRNQHRRLPSGPRRTPPPRRPAPRMGRRPRLATLPPPYRRQRTGRTRPGRTAH